MGDSLPDLLVAEVLIKKNARHVLRLALHVYKSRQLCSLRIWSPPPDGGPLLPGREGIALRVHLLPELIVGLQRLEADARRIGWIAPSASGAALCEACGDPFEADSVNARFCSTRCRQRASRALRRVTNVLGGTVTGCDRVTQPNGTGQSFSGLTMATPTTPSEALNLTAKNR